MISSRMAATVLASVALLPVSGRGQTAVDPATQQFDRAMHFQSEELFVPAIAAWDMFLHDFPADGRAAKASCQRGFCLFQAKQFDKAQDALRKVDRVVSPLGAARRRLPLPRHGPVQPRPAGEVGDLRHGRRRRSTRWRPGFPQSKLLPDALLFRRSASICGGRRRRRPVATRTWPPSTPSHKLAAHALYMAGFAALETGDYAAALKHAQAFLAAHPNDNLAADVRHVAAESQLLLGRFAESQQTYGKLLEKYPNHADVSALAGPPGDGPLSPEKVPASDRRAGVGRRLDPGPGAGLPVAVPLGQQQAGARAARGGGEGLRDGAGRRSQVAAGGRDPAGAGRGLSPGRPARPGPGEPPPVDRRFARQSAVGPGAGPAGRGALSGGRLSQRGGGLPGVGRSLAAQSAGAAGPLRAGRGGVGPEKPGGGRAVADGALATVAGGEAGRPRDDTCGARCGTRLASTPRPPTICSRP